MSSEKIRNTAETFRRTRGKAANGGAETPETRANGSVAARAKASPNGSCAAKKANGRANGSANHAAAAVGATDAEFRANGHGRAFESVLAAPAPPVLPDAASDGARVNPNAAAACPAVAGMVRDAHAEVAEGGIGASGALAHAHVHEHARTFSGPADGLGGVPRWDESAIARVNGDPRPSSAEEEQSRMDGIAPRVPSENTQRAHGAAAPNDGGETPLPEDPADFVQEIHRRVDLIEMWIGKLTSEDEKISQRALEKLTDMLYKGAALVEEPQHPVLLDFESAVGRRALGVLE